MAEISTKKKKNYIKGSAREKVFDNGGSVINVDLNIAELSAIANEKGYVKITLSRLREQDMYGNHFAIYENDFVPTKQKETPIAKPVAKAAGKKSYDATDDLPF